MTILLYIREARDSASVVLGIECEGERIRLSVGREFFLSLGISEGETLDEETFDTLRREDERRRAKKKALSILGYADNSRKNLYIKLGRAGFSRELSRACVEECLALGYIREREQLRRLILTEANTRLVGRGRITAKLASRGYSRTDIEEVTDELVSLGEIDFEENFEALMEKYPEGTDRRQIKYKHGYM